MALVDPEPTAARGQRRRRVWDRLGRGSAGRLRSALAVSRHRVLRRFWLSQIVSESGDWVGLLGVAALLYQRTGQALWAASAVTALYLPYLLSPLLAGFAAKVAPRTLFVGADLLRAGLVGLMLVPGMPTWALLLLVFAAAVPASVYEATASAAVPEYAPDEVTRDDALVLFQSTQQGANMLGFLLGGALLATVGVSAAIAVNAASYLCSALLLSRIPPIAPFAGEHDSSLGLAIRGFRALARRPLLRRSVVLVVVTAGTIMAGEALVVVYADATGHQGWAGPMAATTAATAAAVGLLLPRHRDSEALLRLSTGWMLLGSVAAALVFLAPPAAWRGFAGFFALGLVSAPGVLTYVVAVREMSAAIRAPVFALVQVMLMGGQALVAVVAGGVADRVGVGQAIALLQLPAVVVTLPLVVRALRVRRVLDVPQPEGATP